MMGQEETVVRTANRNQAEVDGAGRDEAVAFRQVCNHQVRMGNPAVSEVDLACALVSVLRRAVGVEHAVGGSLWYYSKLETCVYGKVGAL
jgi:hypothetical protein